MRDFGETDTTKRVIRINKRKSKKKGRGEVIDTIVHEEMHARHPRMRERTVEKKTPRLVKRMIRRVKAKLYSRYSMKKHKKHSKKPSLGSGGRFQALKSTLGRRPGVTNPGALAAWIGRRKYGPKKMAQLSAGGRRHSKKKPKLGSGYYAKRLRKSNAMRNVNRMK